MPHMGETMTSGDVVRDRVQRHFGEVETEARRMQRRLGPHLRGFVGEDDLVSWGSLGLMEAARRYEPSRGVPFQHYARHRVRGAMVDGLREAHETPQRLYRARVADEGEAGTEADHVLSHHARRVAGARSSGWLAETGSDDFGEPVALASDPDPESIASERQLAVVVDEALDGLPETEAELIRQHVLEDAPLADVARDLEISVPRANQLRARALRRLAPRLRGLAQPHGGESLLSA